MIDWKRKLSSRKFWACFAALIGAVLVFFNMDSASIERIIALIGAFGTMITYILVEGDIDAKSVTDK